MKLNNKLCPKCNKSKLISEFGHDKSKEDRHNVRCLICCRESQRKKRHRRSSIERKIYKSESDISQEDKVYLAGLFDGEGCIILVKERKTGITVRLQISLSVKEKFIIEWIVEVFGGRIFHEKKKDIYQWCATSNEAGHVLKMICPFLKIKQKRATIALDFLVFQKTVIVNKDTRNDVLKTRMEFLEKIRTLNRRDILEDIE